MQRVKEIRRKRDDPPGLAAEASKSARVTINCDILFLLSLTNPNIKRVLPRLSANSGRAGPTNGSLRIEHSYSFDKSLRFYVDLRVLHIKNVSSVCFKAMEGKSLDTLVLDSVSRFDFSEEPIVAVCQLVLTNIRISSKDFICMMNTLAPTSLKLVNTHLQENSGGAVYQVLSKIMLLDLWSMETEGSFMDIDGFFYLVREKRLGRFSFTSSDKLLSYSHTGVSLSYLVLKGIGDGTLKLISDRFLGIEALVLKSQQSPAGIPSDITRNIRHLVLEGFCICSQLLGRFGKPSSVVLRQCSFENLYFYGFVDLFRDNLRYLSLKHMEMPLDCIAYMKKRLVNCRVELNSNLSFHIP